MGPDACSEYNHAIVQPPWVAQSLESVVEGGIWYARKHRLDTFLAKASKDQTILTPSRKQILFAQGDAADAVFYIQSGKVKLTVVSEHGKEAVVAILEQGAFLGDPARGTDGSYGNCEHLGRLPHPTHRQSGHAPHVSRTARVRRGVYGLFAGSLDQSPRGLGGPARSRYQVTLISTVLHERERTQKEKHQ